MSDPELSRLVADLFPELLSNIPTNSYVVPRNIMRDPTEHSSSLLSYLPDSDLFESFAEN